MCLGRSLGGVQGVGWGAGTSGGETENLAEGFVAAPGLSLGVCWICTDLHVLPSAVLSPGGGLHQCCLPEETLANPTASPSIPTASMSIPSQQLLRVPHAGSER